MNPEHNIGKYQYFLGMVVLAIKRKGRIFLLGNSKTGQTAVKARHILVIRLSFNSFSFVIWCFSSYFPFSFFFLFYLSLYYLYGPEYPNDHKSLFVMYDICWMGIQATGTINKCKDFNFFLFSFIYLVQLAQTFTDVHQPYFVSIHMTNITVRLVSFLHLSHFMVLVKLTDVELC